MKSNKNNKLVVFCLCCLLTVFSIVSISYISNVKRLLETETNMHLQEIALQTVQTIRAKVQSDIEELAILATGYLADETVPMEDKLNWMESVATRHDYLRLGYAKLDGNAVTTDGQSLYVGDRQFFLSAREGDAAISEPLSDRLGPWDIIVYAVPVHKDDKVIGVLFATSNIEQMNISISSSYFNGEGYSFLVNKEGTVIIEGNDTKVDFRIYTVEERQGEIYKEISPQLQLSILENSQGAQKVSLPEGDVYVAYTPVYINDWYLLCTVPGEAIFANSNRVVSTTFLLLSGFTVLFFLVLVYVIVQHRRNEKLVNQLAYKDALTQIGNNNSFYRDCKRLVQDHNAVYALLYMDIDNFKAINDTFGYVFGDAMLKQIAQVLREIFPKETFARLSNDYFAVLLKYDGDRQKLCDQIMQIQTRINDCCKDEQTNLNISISVGIHIISDSDDTVNNMINKANMARKTVKGQNIVAYAFYDEKMRKALTENTMIENGLHKAIKNREFTVYYQPKCDLRDGKMVGSEALIRWKHPEKGFIRPDIFIPIAEKNGIIVEIGKLMLEQVCADIHQWQQEGLEAVPVSVNLSRVDLYQVDLLENIQNTLDKYHIENSMIEVELTETAALNDLSFTQKMMNEIHKMNIKISMDDFGTGYSSLSCLKSVPIDTLKLDRSFLVDIETNESSRNIVKAIIALAKSLGLQVVAEGVETKKQIEYLAQWDCNIIQGFYFAKPMTEEDLRLFMQTEGTKEYHA